MPPPVTGAAFRPALGGGAREAGALAPHAPAAGRAGGSAGSGGSAGRLPRTSLSYVGENLAKKW